jgi:hypothetical protein
MSLPCRSLVRYGPYYGCRRQIGIKDIGPINFDHFATMNTAMLLRADTRVHSHIPDFVWMCENRKTQTDWKLFSKDTFRNIDS